MKIKIKISRKKLFLTFVSLVFLAFSIQVQAFTNAKTGPNVYLDEVESVDFKKGGKITIIPNKEEYMNYSNFSAHWDCKNTSRGDICEETCKYGEDSDGLCKLPSVSDVSKNKEIFNLAPNTIIKDHGATSGTDYNEKNLKYIIDTIGLKEAIIVIPEDYTAIIKTSLIFPKNITVYIYGKLDIEADSTINGQIIAYPDSFNIASNKTITFSSTDIETKRKQIFNGDGKIVLAENTVVYPEWFSGNGIGANLNASANALPLNGGIIDARGYSGEQSITEQVKIDKNNIKLIFGEVKFTLSGVSPTQTPVFGTHFFITNDNVWIIGGKTKFFHATGSKSVMFTFYNSHKGGIRTIEMDGNKKNNKSITDDTFQSGVDIINNDKKTGSYTTIEQCSIHDFNHYGIMTYGIYTNGNIFQNNRIYSNGGDDNEGTGDGIYINRGTYENTVKGNYIYKNKRSGVKVTAVGDNQNENKIIKNYIYSNGTVTDNSGIFIIEESNLGSKSNTGQTNLLIDGNNIYDNEYGIRCGAYDVGYIKNYTFSNNQIYSNNKYGIFLQSNSDTLNNTRNGIISDNKIYKNTSAGIVLTENVLDTNIKGNYLSQNSIEIYDKGTGTINNDNKEGEDIKIDDTITSKYIYTLTDINDKEIKIWDNSNVKEVDGNGELTLKDEMNNIPNGEYFLKVEYTDEILENYFDYLKTSIIVHDDQANEQNKQSSTDVEQATEGETFTGVENTPPNSPNAQDFLVSEEKEKVNNIYTNDTTPTLKAQFNDENAYNDYDGFLNLPEIFKYISKGHLNFRISNKSFDDCKQDGNGIVDRGKNIENDLNPFDKGSWTPSDLSKGTYFWCVQGEDNAIPNNDSSGEKSSWVDGGQIVIDNEPPEITTFESTHLEDKRSNENPKPAHDTTSSENDRYYQLAGYGNEEPSKIASDNKWAFGFTDMMGVKPEDFIIRVYKCLNDVCTNRLEISSKKGDGTKFVDVNDWISIDTENSIPFIPQETKKNTTQYAIVEFKKSKFFKSDGSVDFNGKYLLSFTAVDLCGNTSVVSRIINIMPNNIVEKDIKNEEASKISLDSNTCNSINGWNANAEDACILEIVLKDKYSNPLYDYNNMKIVGKSDTSLDQIHVPNPDNDESKEAIYFKEYNSDNIYFTENGIRSSITSYQTDKFGKSNVKLISFAPSNNGDKLDISLKTKKHKAIGYESGSSSDYIFEISKTDIVYTALSQFNFEWKNPPRYFEKNTTTNFIVTLKNLLTGSPNIKNERLGFYIYVNTNGSYKTTNIDGDAVDSSNIADDSNDSSNIATWVKNGINDDNAKTKLEITDYEGDSSVMYSKSHINGDYTYKIHFSKIATTANESIVNLSPFVRMEIGDNNYNRKVAYSIMTNKKFNIPLYDQKAVSEGPGMQQDDSAASAGEGSLTSTGDIKIQVLTSSLKSNIKSKILNINDSENSGVLTTLESFDSNVQRINNKRTYLVKGDNKNLIIEGENNILDIGSTPISFVTYGGNIIIKSNIKYSTSSKPNIAFISLRNEETGLGGEIQIANTTGSGVAITNIVGSYIAERGIISLHSDPAIGVNMNLDQRNDLFNQLLLEGSIMAANTRGGADAGEDGNYICPAFIRKQYCDEKTAQKYDVNYLRRFIPEKIDDGALKAKEPPTYIDDVTSNAPVIFRYYVNKESLPDELK